MMPRYEKYKDSGMEWVGEIPEHWEVRRLKDFSAIKYGLGQPPREKSDGLPLIRATNVFSGRIDAKDLLFIDPDDIPYERDPVLRENDIIVVRSGAYTADSAIIPKEYDGAITGYDMVVRCNANINAKFVSYTFLSSYVLASQLLLNSLRAAQPHLNKEELGKTIIVFPNITEQTAIANYLDERTAKLDKLIKNKGEQIEKLKEMRQIEINTAVTKGLNPDAKMKPSGIEWLGDIPEHWEMRRLKDKVKVNIESLGKETYPEYEIKYLTFPKYGLKY